jgi:hypothetical protein
MDDNAVSRLVALALRLVPFQPSISSIRLLLAVLGLLGTALLSAGGSEPSRRDSAEPEWCHLAQYEQTEKGTTFYADILNHSRDKKLALDDRPTMAHETTHFIHSYLRNKYTHALGRRVNGFYVGRDRAVILDEPAVRKSAVADFVPASLRGDRFEHYVIGQKDWDDTPLYLFDEWVAYVNDATVAIEDAAASKEKPDGSRNNGVHSCVEFVVYATALAMAVEKHDPAYFARNQQFKRFLCWHLKRSMETYRQGMRYEQFRWKPAYLHTLRSGPEAHALRTFLDDKLGLDPDELFAADLPLASDLNDTN